MRRQSSLPQSFQLPCHFRLMTLNYLSPATQSLLDISLRQLSVMESYQTTSRGNRPLLLLTINTIRILNSVRFINLFRTCSDIQNVTFARPIQSRMSVGRTVHPLDSHNTVVVLATPEARVTIRGYRNCKGWAWVNLTNTSYLAIGIYPS